MLKLAAKMTLVLSILGMSACAYIPVQEEPRTPSSVVEESAKPMPWHYPFVQKSGGAKPGIF
ncbi:hypothetical protein ACLVWU_10130 [Bdellovibrio sp. HCB290]|uniref:hypothetical protein n=1 Tax=Bdellovibrio sp. HCB290 TaxID=3394356 RepID=UPI0039B45AFE